MKSASKAKSVSHAGKLPPLVNREISWLSFNRRVLQEAEDTSVPVIERMRFLGIFSNNLDEFFRVRVATVRRMVTLGKTDKDYVGPKPKKLLSEIQTVVLSLQERFGQIYNQLLDELKNDHIFMLTEKDLTPSQGQWVKSYFQETIRPALTPLMLDHKQPFPYLRDRTIYLAVCMTTAAGKHKLALIDLPTRVLPRFIQLPRSENNQYIMLLDDVIRYCLDEMFSIFRYQAIEAFTIKITRDAELDIDHDISKSFLEKMSKSLKQRTRGDAVRFVYDRTLPEHFLEHFKKKMKLTDNDTVIPGGRYHNFRDFMKFPNPGKKLMEYKALRPLLHRDLEGQNSVLNVISKKDVLLHFPFQSFGHMIDLLREAAIDPKVVSIQIATYRLAKNSHIINALANAARNGKKVTVIMELQARFDEEANIRWSNMLQEEGVNVMFSSPGLKVHSKICLITRKQGHEHKLYATVGTGNFNEVTARVYSDHTLMTSDPRITEEVRQVFYFLENNYKTFHPEHLLVSPFSTRKSIIHLISQEIKHAKAKKPAYIILKLNNLVDTDIIRKLYAASQAGVKIQLIIRGVCALQAGVKGYSENIKAISIVDQFLEHSRVYIFGNGGQEKIFISSADMMKRNLDHRVEVTCPVYDPALQQELKDMIRIQLEDNVKARILDPQQRNRYVQHSETASVRSQLHFYHYLKGSKS
ncbi:MAG: polyphosphate kinase 1 [Flavobacteriales bacterium]|nr:polyphosphate kinase 1 [Flavobacteriales bacterium]MCB9446853.1 polyphosphate kinase 1 [Flavobacteriales bacterium]